MRRTGTPLTIVALALTLALTACGYDDDHARVHLADPGNCIAVDVAAARETASLLDGAAARFNGSAAARLPRGECVVVRVQPVDAPVALRELTGNWPDTDRYGPPPTVWVPGSAIWGGLLNVGLTRAHRRPMAPKGTPFARSPLVVAMPRPMASALAWPQRPMAWTDLEQLAQQPRGWGAYGHPEWGRFRLGKGNPYWSTTGLDQTVALQAAPGAASRAALLEQATVYYSDSTRPYFDNWEHLAKKSTSSALRYLSAAITDERSVVAYNTGHSVDDASLTGEATRPALPLVAIYPK